MSRLIFALTLIVGLFAGVELRWSNPAGMPSSGEGRLSFASLRGVSSLTSPAVAASKAAAWPGPFAVEILAVKDGDTVEVEFREGPCGRGPCAGSVVNLRILGVDAPEAHRCREGRRGRKASAGQSCAACEAEWLKGREALAFTRELVEGRRAQVSGMRPDKYGGRIVAALEVERDGAWVSVGDELLAAGLAATYDGGRKNKIWCAR